MLTLIRGLKAYLYDLITSSRVVYYLIPILRPLVGIVCFGTVKGDYIEDEGGATMRVTTWRGKVFPAFGEHRLSAIKDLRIRKSDVILCGYPKTGCHWTFEILKMLVNKDAKLTKYGKGFEGMMDAMPHIVLDSLPSPRVMNSHLLYEELPRGVVKNKNKIILTIRNPKDTVVSFYYHTLNIKPIYQYKGTFDNYFKMFIKGQVDYGDYFEFYSSWNRVIEDKNSENEIFLLEFEELKESPAKKIMEMAEFLGISITPEFAEEIAQVSSFSNMKKARAKSSPIFRKGIIGDWKNELTDAQAMEIDNAWRQKMPGFKLSSQKASMS